MWQGNYVNLFKMMTKFHFGFSNTPDLDWKRRRRKKIHIAPLIIIKFTTEYERHTEAKGLKKGGKEKRTKRRILYYIM